MDNNVSLGLAHETEVMLRKVGATRENFWIPISKDEEFARQLVEIAIARPSYDVVVDYSCTLAEMIETGKYDWVNDNITTEHFAVEGDDKHEVVVTLFHFNRYIELDEVIAEMEKQGFRQVNIAELLAFGEQHPEVQRDFPIVGLGSVWRRPNGHCYVPCLSGRWAGERRLPLDWLGSGWAGVYRFAGVRK